MSAKRNSMGRILCLETATKVCSVALGSDGELLALEETREANSHASQLTTLITRSLKTAGCELAELDAVAVSMGPGSYTGLRIGVSTAKGLCYGLGKPLIAVHTLQAMAVGMAQQSPASANSLWCPMIDARRMEVYMGLYNDAFETVKPVTAEILTPETFTAFAQHRIVCAGDGAAKATELFAAQPNLHFPEINIPSAKYMLRLAEQAFQMKNFADTAYFEPFYLKDFVAGKPKVKGL